MAITVQWENLEKTIVCQTYNGVWPLEELPEAISKSADLINSVDHPVDVIIDLTDNGVETFSVLSSLRSIERKEPKNQRAVVIIGATFTVNMLIRIGRTIAPSAGRYLQLAKSKEEAYKIIDQITEEI